MARRQRLPAFASHTDTRRAAQYMRMSTDMQCYSIEHQSAEIAAYALAHRLTIERTYVDAGKSGLTLQGRSSLQALLADVEAGAPFDVLLVFDVSRWGRFQDPDEAAYYEHLCRRAGVEIIYCAEPFENDGSPMAVLLKSLKRAMAAEFSRELSAKVSNAKRRLAAKGFPQGGAAPIGLRRRLSDPDGVILGILEKGQRKAVREYKIDYVHGPPREVAAVRLVFWFYVERRLQQREIARRLNLMELVPRSPPWSQQLVRAILTNPRYVGDLVYGRESWSLKGRVRYNPPETWTVVRDAFAPIVERDVFDRAQRMLLCRTGAISRDAMIRCLDVLLQAHGTLSGRVIDADPETPSARRYRSTFGSLAAAYAQISQGAAVGAHPLGQRSAGSSAVS